MANCGTCVKLIKANQLKLVCSDFDREFHGTCLKMTKADVVCLTADGLQWRCTTCASERRKIMRFDADAQEGKLSLEDIMKKMLEIIENQKTQEKAFNKSYELMCLKMDENRTAINEQKDKLSKCLNSIEQVMEDNCRLNKRVAELEKRLEESEQYSRMNSVEIHGIPVQPNEDAIGLVKEVGRALDFSVNDQMIDTCHRLGSRAGPGNSPPGIIVKFVRRIDKEEFLRRRRVKRNLSTRHLNMSMDQAVYVNESLTPARGRLMSAARKVKRDKNFRHLLVRRGRIFLHYESPQSKVDMVASLQSRRDSLEAKLKEKNEELKTLCIQEAELTGVLPPEIPLEAGESPPVYRRRVGTVFTYPENLINKLKSKEEESLATLELEFNIQTGIAEAARSLAHDSTASKAVRRKHRVVYQQSQRRLLELEARLNLLRQASRCPLKQRKKPRPPLESELDNGVNTDMVNGVSLSPVQEKIYHPSHQQGKHQIQSLGLVTERSHMVSSCYNSARDPPLHNYNRNSQRPVHAEVPYTQNWAYQQYPREIERQQRINFETHGNRSKEGNNWYNTAPTSRYLGVGAKPEEDDREKSVHYRDRYGSLDRRRGGGVCSSMGSVEPELCQSPVHHRLYSPSHHLPSPTVLLPNQTYPENSLMHTQSVMADHSSRRSKEKDWFETALDTGPHPSPMPPPAHSHHSGSEGDPAEIQHPITQQHSFDTVVPFESPKNHTVVQAGMWQPYREVTKPFEMADFYKYSTKFRKNMTGLQPVPQQKAVYQPLQPMTCQPLTQQESGNEVGASATKDKISNGPNANFGDKFSHEMLSWYQDQSTPPPCSATLV